MINRIAPILAVAVLLAGPALADRQVESAHPFSGEELVVDFSIGELEITTTDTGAVEVDLRVDCEAGLSASRKRRCEERFAEVDVEWKKRGDNLYLDFVGMPKRGFKNVDVEARVRVPKGADLTVDMGVGELDIDAPSGNLSIDLGIGEVSVRAAEAGTGHVHLDAGIGDAELRSDNGYLDGKRSFLIGSELEWDGEANGREIFVDVGIGEASVSLR